MALEKVGVQATIEGLNAFNNGMRKMERGVESFGKEALTASKRTEILTGALKKTGLALTVAAAASGALLFSSVKLAARVETLGVVTATLGRNVGKTEKEIRDLEKAVAAEGITLRGTRKAIALMIQSRVDLSKATELATLAQNAAVIADVDSTEAFERLIFVITSGNVRMARTLGLQVSFAQGMEKMAVATGKTAAELTPLERIQARTNEILEAGTTIVGAYDAAMDTAGKKVNSLNRLIEESKRTLGEAWLPTYASVIDFITKTLKTWLALDQSQKDVISSTVGMTIAVTGLLGVTLLLAAKVPGLIAAFTGLAAALGISAIALGVVLAAVVAVSVALVMLFKTISKVKQGFKDITKAIKEQELRTRKTADSYEDYRKELERVGKVTRRVVGTQKELDDKLARGEIFVREYRDAIIDVGKETFKAERIAQGLTEVTDELSRDVVRGTVNMRDFAASIEGVTKSEEELAAEQEILQGQLSALQLTISTDITPQFEDYREKVIDLTATIEELAAIKDPTKEQRDSLESARGELEETQKAWDKTTANIIFNLAEQRLAMSDIAPQEVFNALRKLAGPEGLGLVDAAGAALIEKIDLVVGAMDAAGDQSDLFGEDLVALQAMMLDPTTSAEDLKAAIDSLQSKTITVTTTFVDVFVGGGRGGTTATQRRESAASIAARAAATARAAAAAARAGGGGRRQHGGFVQAGRSFMVGEGGREMFVPRQSGTILSNRFVGAITSLVAALKSAPALMAAPMTPVSAGSVTNNEFTMNINTRAPSEPIIADFRTLQSMVTA